MLLTYETAAIPQTLSMFYELAYEVLFERHDIQLKYGFIREIRSGLNIQEFRKIFSAFSMQTSYEDKTDFISHEVIEYLENCKKGQIIAKNFESADFLQDALKSVCLLIEDGLSIKFTHRSFQEYFTARFIADESNENLQKELLKKYIYRLSKDNVINLLYEIKPDLVEKLFIIPSIEKLTNSAAEANMFFYSKWILSTLEMVNFYYKPENRTQTASITLNEKFFELSHFSNYLDFLEAVFRLTFDRRYSFNLDLDGRRESNKSYFWAVRDSVPSQGFLTRTADVEIEQSSILSIDLVNNPNSVYFFGQINHLLSFKNFKTLIKLKTDLNKKHLNKELTL